MSDDDTVLGVAAAAKALGVGESTVRRMADDGRLRRIPGETTRLFARDEVAAVRRRLHGAPQELVDAVVDRALRRVDSPSETLLALTRAMARATLAIDGARPGEPPDPRLLQQHRQLCVEVHRMVDVEGRDRGRAKTEHTDERVYHAASALLAAGWTPERRYRDPATGRWQAEPVDGYQDIIEAHARGELSEAGRVVEPAAKAKSKAKAKAKSKAKSKRARDNDAV